MTTDPTEERIASLTARIDELEQKQEALRDDLVQAQLEQWKGRIDDLEVQAHLGSREVQDRLEPIVSQLRDALLDARARAGDAASMADDVMASIRRGLESAFDDLKKAVRDARSTVTG